MKILRTATAWELIGFDGIVRIKGGRATYEAVMYNCANGGELVKLARLECDQKVREVSRYVKPDTILEVLEITKSFE